MGSGGESTSPGVGTPRFFLEDPVTCLVNLRGNGEGVNEGQGGSRKMSRPVVVVGDELCHEVR